MPPLAGARIEIRLLANPHALRGRVTQGGTGEAVHAASFIRRRRIVLDSALLGRPREFARILIHEVFHFVWVRSGNGVRRSWEQLLANEYRQGAAGELGWSAERRKKAPAARHVSCRNRRWREYMCESFCDTAAWLLAGASRHAEFTLGSRYRAARAAWFRALLGRAAVSI